MQNADLESGLKVGRKSKLKVDTRECKSVIYLLLGYSPLLKDVAWKRYLPTYS
jgi:hypothetical protein